MNHQNVIIWYILVAKACAVDMFGELSKNLSCRFLLKQFKAKNDRHALKTHLGLIHLVRNVNDNNVNL